MTGYVSDYRVDGVVSTRPLRGLLEVLSAAPAGWPSVESETHLVGRLWSAAESPSTDEEAVADSFA